MTYFPLYQAIKLDERGNIIVVLARDLSIDKANEYYQHLQTLNASNAQLQNQMFGIAYQGPAPEMETVITVGELEGWRLWAVLADGELNSMSRGYIWEDGEAHGSVTEYGHEGVYCFNTREEALHEFKRAFGNVAVGRVSLHGTVMEHAHGYRAEHAKVTEIFGIKGRFYPKKFYKNVIKLDPDLPKPEKDIDYLARARFWGILSIIGLTIWAMLMAGQVALLVAKWGS
jgi:hypothetical protein